MLNSIVVVVVSSRTELDDDDIVVVVVLVAGRSWNKVVVVFVVVVGTSLRRAKEGQVRPQYYLSVVLSSSLSSSPLSVLKLGLYNIRSIVQSFVFET